MVAFDYEDERKKFTWDIPEDYNFLDNIGRWTKKRTKLMAITEHPDGEVEKATYWEVWDNAMRFGNILRDSDIQKGDRILVILPRGIDVYVSSFGIWAIGGVVVPGTIMLRRRDIEYRIFDAGIKALITGDAEVAAEMDTLKDKISIDNLFFLGEREGWRNLRVEANLASRELELEKIKKVMLLPSTIPLGPRARQKE